MTPNCFHFTLLPCVLLCNMLSISPAQAQISAGSQSQLRPTNRATIAPQAVLVPPPKTAPLSAQTNMRKVHKAVQVELPVTDFGRLGTQKEVQLEVTVQEKYVDIMAGDLSKSSAEKASTVPDIKISGPQAAAFVAGPPKCSGHTATDPNSGDSHVVWGLTCYTTVTFRPTTDGVHTAFLTASYLDGDRFTGQLKGSKSVALPSNGANMGSGLHKSR